MRAKPVTAKSLREYLRRSDSVLPEAKSLEEAAEEIRRIHQESGGATFSLYFGSQAGKRLYSVSVYPDRMFRRRSREIDGDTLKAFIKANAEILREPRCCIGIWYSEETGFTYLDISVTLLSKREAITLGRHYNQEGIFDLFRMEYLPTSGDGAAPETMPPLEGRLPKIKRRGS